MLKTLHRYAALVTFANYCTSFEIVLIGTIQGQYSCLLIPVKIKGHYLSIKSSLSTFVDELAPYCNLNGVL